MIPTIAEDLAIFLSFSFSQNPCRFSLLCSSSSSFFFFFFFLFNRLMDSPKLYSNRAITSVTLILIIFLMLFPSNSGSGSPSTKDGNKGLNQQKLTLGSRPPRCFNKCLSCRPCMAALVISPHHRVGHIQKETAQRDEGYYLLSWRCKCGNKFFQP